MRLEFGFDDWDEGMEPLDVIVVIRAKDISGDDAFVVRTSPGTDDMTALALLHQGLDHIRGHIADEVRHTQRQEQTS